MPHSSILKTSSAVIFSQNSIAGRGNEEKTLGAWGSEWRIDSTRAGVFDSKLGGPERGNSQLRSKYSKRLACS